MFGTRIKIATAAMLLAVVGIGTALILNRIVAAEPPTKTELQPPDAGGGKVPPPLRGATKTTGILVLDDCDFEFRGKKKYQDNLTLIDSSGAQTFQVSGFNNCEGVCSNRRIAADPARKCIWVVENAAKRIRRFDFTGKETLLIDGVEGSAIAVDPETGNVWSTGTVRFRSGEVKFGDVAPRVPKFTTDVYDTTGKLVSSYDVFGWDIAYDAKAKAFWISGRKLTKLTSAKGEVVFSVDVSVWYASTVDVDPKSGAAWVAVRKLKDLADSRNRLLKFSADGKELAALELGDKKEPFRVSIDPKSQSVWVAHFGKSIERFSVDGKSEKEIPVEALAVQVDPAGGDVWVATQTEVQKMTHKGEVTKRVSHVGKTYQVWIAALE